MKNIFLLVLAATLSVSAHSQELTFYKDVLPITLRSCVPCHRDGEVAPFPLITYQQVAAKAKLVRHTTKTRFMPPWLPDPNFRDFANARHLSPSEIETIDRWVAQGKKKGNVEDGPEIPEFTNNSLIPREPDLRLRFPRPVFIQGNNKEIFIVIKIPIELDEEAEVEAIEYIPGNRAICHHMNYKLLDMTGYTDCLYEGQNNLVMNFNLVDDIFSSLNLLMPDGRKPKDIFTGAWVPGMSPQIYPGEFGIKIPKKAVLLVNVMHYAASPIDTYDDSYYNVYFKKKGDKVKRIARSVTLGSGVTDELIRPPLVIQANTVSKHTIDALQPIDISIMYLQAHMHMIGRSFIAYAKTPSNKEIPLLKIDAWDFNWQEFYQFNPMLKLPAGTTIHVEGVYDNTLNNPNNPFNPPRKIVSEGNMETTNEMFNLILLAFPYEEGDETAKY